MAHRAGHRHVSHGTTTEWSPDRDARRSFSPAAVAALIAVGIGLLMGSIWASRSQNVFGLDVNLPAPRAIATLCLIALAAGVMRRRIPMRTFLGLASLAFAGHVVCALVALAGPGPETLSALALASYVFEGMSIAATLCFLLTRALDLPARTARIAIAVGFLLATSYDMVFFNLGQSVGFAQWLIGGGLALAICWALEVAPGQPAPASAKSRDIRAGNAQSDAADDGAPEGAATEIASGSEPFAAAPAATSPLQQNAIPDSRPSSPLERISWPMGLAFAFALMLIQGLAAQATGYGGTGAGARFGYSGDIISLVTRVLILVYCLFAERGPKPLALAGALTAVWYASLTCIVVGWGGAGASFGELLLEAGYNILQVAVLLAAHDFARNHAGLTVSAMCIGAAAMLANQVTRVVGVLAIHAPQADAGLAAAISLGGLGVLIALGMALVALQVRAVKKSGGMAASRSLAFVDGSGSGDPGAGSLGSTASPSGDAAAGDRLVASAVGAGTGGAFGSTAGGTMGAVPVAGASAQDGPAALGYGADGTPLPAGAGAQGFSAGAGAPGQAGMAVAPNAQGFSTGVAAPGSTAAPDAQGYSAGVAAPGQTGTATAPNAQGFSTGVAAPGSTAAPGAQGFSAAAAAAPADSSAAGYDPDSFMAREADFCRRFERICEERGLTPREREVLFIAVHGYTIDNIADRLTISRETVKSTLTRAYAHAGVNGKQALLALMDQLPAE